jgi:hypothetical protein
MHIELFRSAKLKLFFKGSDVPCDFVVLAHGPDAATLCILHDNVVQTQFLMDLASVVHEMTPRKRNVSEGEPVQAPGSALFAYKRFESEASFAFLADEDASDLDKIRYILHLYTLYGEFHDAEEDGESLIHAPNAAARSIEGVGFAIRSGLQATGKLAGDGIRTLGKAYSDLTAPALPISLSAQEAEDAERRAEMRRESARKFKDMARGVSSAIMFPIRWTGQKAAKLAETDNVPANGSVQKIAIDTVGGIGNAVVAVAKGLYDVAVSVYRSIYSHKLISQ